MINRQRVNFIRTQRVPSIGMANVLCMRDYLDAW